MWLVPSVQDSRCTSLLLSGKDRPVIGHAVSYRTYPETRLHISRTNQDVVKPKLRSSGKSISIMRIYGPGGQTRRAPGKINELVCYCLPQQTLRISLWSFTEH